MFNKNEVTNLKNYFLIAMPTLKDPLFKQSVIYICEHNNTGAMGIIINKPIRKYTIEIMLKSLKIVTKNRDPEIQLNNPIFSGGPLLNDCGFILHTPKTGFESSISVSSQTMITTSKDILETLGTYNQPKNILVALGYSGWSKGQLEQELIKNSWITAPADEKILFNTPIFNRWNAAVQVLGINVHNINSQMGHS